MKETFSKIWAKTKRFAREFFAFGSSRIFLKNFGGVLAMLLVLFFFTTTWLKCYTDHGEGVHLANFEGMNLMDAQDQASNLGFDLVVDSVSMDNVAPLTIIEQNPNPDALVKEGRTIYLRVVKVLKEKKSIPPTRSLDATAYRKILKESNFKVSTQYKVDSKVAPNTVLDVLYDGKSIFEEIESGDYKLEGGNTITIVSSQLGYGNVNVPNLICKSLREVTFMLESNNLTYNIERDQSIDVKRDGRNAGYVWFQDPAAGSSVRYGDQVVLRATKNLPDDCDENTLEAPRENIIEEDSSDDEFY